MLALMAVACTKMRVWIVNMSLSAAVLAEGAPRAMDLAMNGLRGIATYNNRRHRDQSMAASNGQTAHPADRHRDCRLLESE